jgi:hypothetical protein
MAVKLGYTILRAWKKIEYVLGQDTEEDVWSSGRGGNMGIEKIS